MSDVPTEQQDVWIRCVLGVSPAGAKADISPVTADLRSAIAAIAQQSFGETTRSLTLAVNEAEALLAAGDPAAAQSALNRAAAHLHEAGIRQAIAGWQGARLVALNGNGRLTAALRQSDAPERELAAGVLGGIAAHLTETPASVADIDAVLTYLASNGIVAVAEGPNVLGLDIALRAPLAQALDRLRASMAVPGARRQ